MPDYKEMYFQLAAKVEDAIELLIEAKRKCEEEYIKDEDTGSLKELNNKKPENQQNTMVNKLGLKFVNHKGTLT